jgi:UDP-glucuronate 4-epimerase
MRILVTGTSGFIGFHLAKRLIADGHLVVGIDGMTDYYDVDLKRARRDALRALPAFTDHELMLENAVGIQAATEAASPEVIFHLAAQVGVRHSLKHPRPYVESNLLGAFNILEAARRLGVRHLIFASTSSVYGAEDDVPFTEAGRSDHPLSLYAATKKAGEGMTHAYSHLWGIPTTVARFFTVYGPWGRPDMALGRFVDGILRDEPIDVYGGGRLERDFTYVDDLVEALARLMAVPPVANERVSSVEDSLSPVAPWRAVNIGRGKPVVVMDFIAAIEAALGRPARLNLMPIQPGESALTFASADLLAALTGYRPDTPLEVGVKAYCDWYGAYLDGAARPDNEC